MRSAEDIGRELAIAEAARSAYVSETNELVRKIKADRYDGERELATKVHELRRESMQRQDADALAAAHPWTGKIVERTVTKGGRFSFYPKKEVTQRGVVEIVTSKTAWPANRANWRQPSTGTPFVRFLLANGKPGLAWDTLGEGKWTLVKAP